MEENLSLKTIERITSEVLQSLEYKDHYADIDWVKV